MILIFTSLNPKVGVYKAKINVINVLASHTNQLPNPSFLVQPAHLFASSVVKFDASKSQDPDGKIVKYEWDLNGDGEFEKSFDSPIFDHVFDKSGGFQITLRVIDDHGATATFTSAVLVEEPPLIAKRRISENGSDIYELAPGESFEVTVRLKINRFIRQIGLDENLPPGWYIQPIEDSEALIFKRIKAQWGWAQEMKPDDVIKLVYKVRVPRDEKPGLYKIDGKVTSFLPKFKLKVNGDSELRVKK